MATANLISAFQLYSYPINEYLSMKYTEDDLLVLQKFISEERLSNLVSLTGDISQSIELHQDTLRLGSLLITVVATIEISLRNAVCDNLTAHFGVANWLSQPPIILQWRETELSKLKLAADSAKRGEYAKLSQSEKGKLDGLAYPKGVPANNSHLKRSKDRRRMLKISEGKITAELTLYFWKRLYGPDYEQSLWRTTLKRTFPFKKVHRAEVAVQLERIYQARNRLAHHEPVLHRRYFETIDAINFVAGHLGEWRPNPDSPLALLIRDDMAQLANFSSSLHNKLASFKG